MNTRSMEKLSTFQVIMIISNSIFGVGILTLPRTATEKVGTTDSWLAVIVGGLITMVIAVIMIKLCKRYPNKTIYQFSQEIVGKWLGSLISIIIIGYFIVFCGFETRVMAEVTRLFLLQGSPTWAIMMPFLWIGLYLIVGGLNPIVRMLEIIFPITVIVFLLVMFLGLRIFEIDHLRPVLGMGVMPVLKGLKTTSLSFAGFEIILVMFMYMKEQNQAIKATLIGITIPLIFYTITVVIVVGSLSVDGVITQTWPVLSFIRSYEITGLLFERFDSLLMAIWIMQIFSTYIVFYFAAALGLAQLFQKNIQTFIFGILPFIYIIAMIPENINGLFKLGDMISNVALYFLSVLPLFLLIVSMVRGKKHENI